MKLIEYPQQKDWKQLVERPVFDLNDLVKVVEGVIEEVQLEGDKALKRFTLQFDKVSLERFEVTAKEITIANNLVSEELKTAIQVAKTNIEAFHQTQICSEKPVETMDGVSCWRKAVPIEKVGLYIPGGTAPLFSSILMLGIPAKIAGCPEIVLCSPPNKEGNVHPAILYTANLIGITKIFKVGGAQAIAAMALGTATIPKVYKIFGPGNQYVTCAKVLVQQRGIAIDMPAGPSEVLVISDETGNPEFVAADLLSQAEHGADSQVVLLSDNAEFIQKTLEAVQQQVTTLPRKAIALKALENSKAILLDSLDTCMAFSNLYAPEHLIIASDFAEALIGQIQNAGSVFLGNYSCESAGDYASGTNHTLPTNGFARSYSGVSLDSFVKKITFQKITPQGIQNIGKSIEVMAEAEELIAHKNAVTIRLKSLKDV